LIGGASAPLTLLCEDIMPNYSVVNRKTVTPVISRLASNNITKDIFGSLSYKLKRCSSCLEYKVYSDFYLEPGFQHLRRESIGEKHLRSMCVACFDYKQNYVYNLGTRPDPIITATIEAFFVDEETCE
jgi:hypothetical protein